MLSSQISLENKIGLNLGKWYYLSSGILRNTVLERYGFLWLCLQNDLNVRLPCFHLQQSIPTIAGATSDVYVRGYWIYEFLPSESGSMIFLGEILYKIFLPTFQNSCFCNQEITVLENPKGVVLRLDDYLIC